jgi:hypothetical protein
MNGKGDRSHSIVHCKRTLDRSAETGHIAPQQGSADGRFDPSDPTRATRVPIERTGAMTTVEDFQKLAKDNTETATKALGGFSKGLQAIAVEYADYSKKSFEEGSAALEQIAGAKTLDKVVEIQTDYAKKAYDAFVARSTRLGELWVELGKEAAKPFELLVPKSAK